MLRSSILRYQKYHKGWEVASPVTLQLGGLRAKSLFRSTQGTAVLLESRPTAVVRKESGEESKHKWIDGAKSQPCRNGGGEAARQKIASFRRQTLTQTARP